MNLKSRQDPNPDVVSSKGIDPSRVTRTHSMSRSGTLLQHKHLPAWGIGVVVATTLACGIPFGSIQGTYCHQWEEGALLERF